MRSGWPFMARPCGAAQASGGWSAGRGAAWAGPYCTSGPRTKAAFMPPCHQMSARELAGVRGTGAAGRMPRARRRAAAAASGRSIQRWKAGRRGRRPWRPARPGDRWRVRDERQQPGGRHGAGGVAEHGGMHQVDRVGRGARQRQRRGDAEPPGGLALRQADEDRGGGQAVGEPPGPAVRRQRHPVEGGAGQRREDAQAGVPDGKAEQQVELGCGINGGGSGWPLALPFAMGRPQIDAASPSKEREGSASEPGGASVSRPSTSKRKAAPTGPGAAVLDGALVRGSHGGLRFPRYLPGERIGFQGGRAAPAWPADATKSMNARSGAGTRRRPG